MVDESPPPAESVRAGYEMRDVRVSLVAGAAGLLALFGGILLVLLWQVSQYVVPEQKVGGASPPVVMPGELPVNDRIRAVPQPRLDLLGADSLPQHPEDLRVSRQPALHGYEWVENGRVARIPIGRAMDAVVETERAKTAAKKGDGK